MRVDPRTGKTEQLMKDVRIGDLAFNRADKSIWGIRHLNGIATLVRIPPPYKQWDRVHSFAYGTVLYDLDVSPDGTRVSASFGEIDGKQNVRVFSAEKLLARNVTPELQFDFGPSVPSGFVFTRDGKALVGSSYYTGRVEHLPLRPRDQRGLGAEQCGNGILQAGSAARRLGPVRLPLLGRRIRRHAHRGQAARGRQRHHVLRRAPG